MATGGSLYNKETPSLMGMKASPPSPLRMERGVNSISFYRTNNLSTRQLSTRQLEVIIILNYEL